MSLADGLLYIGYGLVVYFVLGTIFFVATKGMPDGIVEPWHQFNDKVLKIGRAVGIACVGLMVLAILIQVFFRYFLNNALPWPDEAARFLMLWMTGLVAPTAFRRGGFVAIDMIVRMLPERTAAFLSLVLLFISAVVLYWGLQIGYSEVTGFGGRGNTASLFVPLNLGDGWCQALGTRSAGDTSWCRVPRSWAFLSLFVGIVLMIIVNIELILRSIITLIGQGAVLKPLMPAEDELMAE